MQDLYLAQEQYEAILAEILAGRNLQTHLREVEEAIEAIDKFLAVARLRNEDTTAYEKLKNDIYYLKYEILERL